MRFLQLRENTDHLKKTKPILLTSVIPYAKYNKHVFQISPSYELQQNRITPLFLLLHLYSNNFLSPLEYTHQSGLADYLDYLQNPTSHYQRGVRTCSYEDTPCDYRFDQIGSRFPEESTNNSKTSISRISLLFLFVHPMTHTS